MNRILAFTGQQVERLTGLSPRVLRYWEQTNVYHASYVDQRPRVPYRRIYDFRDLVSLRTLALLRKQYRVPLGELRKAGHFLRATYPDRPDPWAELSFGVVGRRVVFRDPETGVWLRPARDGQAVIPISVETIAREAERDASELTERRCEDIGRVVRHRHVLGNAWRLAGTRIPTTAIWNFHEDGADTARILGAYPDLTAADVAAAIEHERHRRSRSVA